MLDRIRKYAKTGVKVQNLAYLINEESITFTHQRKDGKKAVGVDRVTKEEYSTNLERNVSMLISRMKRQAYRPQPTRRTYIDKPGSNKKRPLGISCYEDKLVENRVAELLNAVYEPKFYDSSFGFRPQKNCHDAVREVIELTQYRKTSYIVEADIRSFFDRIDHEWLMKFLEHDIADKRFLEIIWNMLKAGIMEQGTLFDHEVGSPQGNGASPVLANVYLHYVLDMWFEKVVKKQSKGQAYLVRYTDDFVCCFQYQNEAQAFYEELPKRFAKFGLELAEEKTRILEFGRFATENRAKRGAGKPETFDFLGFTFYCSEGSVEGKKFFYRTKVKSCRKNITAKLKKLNQWLKENRHLKEELLMKRVNQSLVGHYHYYGVTDNYWSVSQFCNYVKALIFKWLNRRSQKKSFTWETFQKGFLQTFPIAIPKTYVSLFYIKSNG